MARTLKSDKVLFITTVLLVCVGVVMVYSASAALANDRFGSSYRFLTKQAMWAVLGFAALAIVMRIDYRTYREPVFIWTTLGLVTFALVAVLFSPPVNNARRWFAIGGLGIQPSEFAKLSAIFFVAALLERRMHRINELRYSVLPIARRGRGSGRADCGGTRLRDVDDDRAHCRGHGVRRRPELRLVRRRCCSGPYRRS